MSRFNLIEEQWIPVRLLDGDKRELGIRDTLLRSKTIAGIEDGSPLATAAIYRLLLAVLYRALDGPADINEARLFFDQGLPIEKITAYLEKWRDRFWLFDEQYPFGQIQAFQPEQLRAWTVLAAEHNADNAKVLFDHVDVKMPGAIPAAAAARWLLATQTFAVSSGKSPLAHTKTAPSATAVMAVPLGADLHDTLLFCLVPQNRLVLEHDLPLWEREPESVECLRQGPERPAAGYADLYTWQTRSVRLECDDSGGVAKLAFASGIAFSPSGLIDPMLGYRIDAKRGRLPVQFQERGFWRDFDSLLPDPEKLAPLVIEHATALTRADPRRFPRSVLVMGQAADQAKIKFWRMERYALPPALAGDRFIRVEVRQLLEDAEKTGRALRSACRSFALKLLGRGKRQPENKEVDGFVAQLAAIPRYWAALETRFHEMLLGYSLDRDPEDIRLGWLQSVKDACQDAWEIIRGSVSTSDAWAIRAYIKAEGDARRMLGELEQEIEALASKGEEE
jgi:CRISPR system Cascade subunit CasA